MKVVKLYQILKRDPIFLTMTTVYTKHLYRVAQEVITIAYISKSGCRFVQLWLYRVYKAKLIVKPWAVLDFTGNSTNFVSVIAMCYWELYKKKTFAHPLLSYAVFDEVWIFYMQNRNRSVMEFHISRIYDLFLIIDLSVWILEDVEFPPRRTVEWTLCATRITFYSWIQLFKKFHTKKVRN